MSELNPVQRGAVEDVFIDVYDLTTVEPQPGSHFEPGYYYNVDIAAEDDVAGVKAEETVRLAGPYPTASEALTAGKAFLRDAIDGATKEAA